MDIYTGWHVFDFRSDGDVSRDKVVSFVPLGTQTSGKCDIQGYPPRQTDHDQP